MRKSNLSYLWAVILLIITMLSCSQSDRAEILTQAAQAGTTIAKVATEAPPALTQASILGKTAQAGGEKLATQAAPYQKTLEAMITKQALPVFNIESNLTETTSVSGSDLDNAIAAIRPDSTLIGLGEAMVRIGEEKGINAYFITALAAHESTWGTSPIAMEKNNLFGYGAYESCPFECAWSFNSKEGSLETVISLIKIDYLTEGGKYYFEPTLEGMNLYYSSNPDWKNGVLKIMNALAAIVYSG